MSDAPLAGLHVLVTRAAEQGAGLADELAARGAEVSSIPLLEFAPPGSWAAADAACDRLAEGGYDAVAFTSANAVGRFLERLLERGHARAWPPAAPVFAVGPRTAAALREHGAAVRDVPDEHRGESLAGTIAEFLGDAEARGARLLLPRAEVANEALPGRLTALGVHVDVAPVYRTVVPDGAAEALRALLSTRPVDLVTFASASAASHFAALLDAPAREGLAGCRFAAIGPVAAQRAASLGFGAAIVPARYTTAALVAAIEDWARARRSRSG